MLNPPSWYMGQNKFTYLGSTLSNTANIDDEVNSRVAKISVAFGRFPSKVWDHRDIHLKTKIHVYKAVITTILLYGYETWTVHERRETTEPIPQGQAVII